MHSDLSIMAHGSPERPRTDPWAQIARLPSFHCCAMITRNARKALALLVVFLCSLAPLLAEADTLDFYGYLTGKTVLMPSGLPALPDSIIADLPADKTNAIPKIEGALSERGLEVVQDGPHFVRVLRKEARGSLTNAPLRGAELAAAIGQQSLGPGTMDFSGAELQQVLSIYAILNQRTILRPMTLPAPPISLKTQCTLSRDEAAYAIETVLALNGICIMDDGAKFAQVVPVWQRDQVRKAAPKPEPGAKLFDPKKVPSVGPPGSSMPAPPPPRPTNEVQRIEQEIERLQQAFYKFLHPPDPSKPAGRRLFELYARLADKTAVPSPKFDGLGIWFHVDTPLSKSELLYAIETTFTLNNLAIIPVDEDEIRLGHISERATPR